MGDQVHRIRLERSNELYGSLRWWACLCGWASLATRYPDAATSAAMVRHMTHPDAPEETAHAAS